MPRAWCASATLRVPMSRMGTAWDVARAAVFLALRRRYITGILLPVDGGMSCRCARAEEDRS
jgi:NAD(P)-dependent dehydrogenase (short-subunit alcohol dehydrogenase family)